MGNSGASDEHLQLQGVATVVAELRAVNSVLTPLASSRRQCHQLRCCVLLSTVDLPIPEGLGVLNARAPGSLLKY